MAYFIKYSRVKILWARRRLFFSFVYPTVLVGIDGDYMRISTKGRYSLEAMLYMSLLKEGEYASTRDISKNTGISEGYLEQLFLRLRKAGLITGVRGPNGGYMLGKSADEISVGVILRSVEGDLKPTECVDAQLCPIETSCLNRRTWKNLYNGIKKFVDSIMLSDLAADYKLYADPEYVI
jgi:Rrf2 family protein